MRKNWREKIVLVCTLGMIALCMCGCGNSKKKQCKDVIKEFETSCNALDVKGMLNCINPTISDPIKALLALGQIVSDQNLDEYVVEIVDSVAGGLRNSLEVDDISMSELISGVKITPEKYKLKSTKGSVTCIAEFNINEMQIKKSICINMIKTNDTWYISGIELINDN